LQRIPLKKQQHESQLLRLINEPELLTQLKQNIGPVQRFKDVASDHDKIYMNLLK